MPNQPVGNLDAGIVLNWSRAGLEALAAAREEIDALNVFPVPDGDTGTNLYLTMESAVAHAEKAADGDLANVARAVAHGALLGAKGNSGVIVAQMLREVADVLSVPGVTLDDGTALANALDHAAKSARDAVAEPEEGTILTVARAAADAAQQRAQAANPSLSDVALAAARAAQAAVARTPDQLDVLRKAGVVDAGGRGLSVLLDAFDTVLTGRRALPTTRRVDQHDLPEPISPNDNGHETPAFEVMYLLDATAGAPEAVVGQLRDRLTALGESVAAVRGSATTWKLHVHTNDAGAAIEAGMQAGAVHDITITHIQPAAHSHRRVRTRALVAFAAGGGLATLFASAGATVVSTTMGYRPSTGELLEAITKAVAEDVVILPNDRDVIPAAEAAAAGARAGGIRVAVIPTIAQVQGLAAAAVHEPARAFDSDVVAMTTAAGHTRHGAVTIATHDAVTMAGVCKAGDVLGVIEGDFAVIGAEKKDVAVEVIGRMMAAGGELVTIVTGSGADPELAAAVEAAARTAHPEAEVVVYAGGQPRYPLLLGVE